MFKMDSHLVVLGFLACFFHSVTCQVTCVCFAKKRRLETEVYDSTSKTNVLGKLKQHACVEVMSSPCSSGWCQVSFKRQTGYVASTSVSKPQQCAHPVKAPKLCLQSHCGTTANVGRTNDSLGYGHYGASRGSRTHGGSDVICHDKDNINAPFAGYVLRASGPYSQGNCKNTIINTGFIYISQDPDWPGYAMQVFYSNSFTPKKSAKTGDKIATHVGLSHCPSYKGNITDHSHVALFKYPTGTSTTAMEKSLKAGGGYGSYRIDPTSFLYCNFPDQVSGGSGAPSSTNKPPTGRVKNWFNCINIKFLKEREGQIRTKGYVPQRKDGSVIGNSGVTIGSGVDLGSKDEPYFQNIDVSAAIITKLAPYFGLKKNDAVAKLKTLPLTLTYAEAKSVSDKVILYITDSIAVEYDQDIAMNKKTFEELTDAQRTVILSVRFQYGSKTQTPNFWTYVTSQNWATVENELRNFGDAYPTRRTLEADLLSNDNGAVSSCNSTTTNSSSAGSSSGLSNSVDSTQTTGSTSNCETHGDLRKLKPTGCSKTTAQNAGIVVKGVQGSEELMKEDFSKLSTHTQCIYSISGTSGIHPALIAAMMSRLSRVGTDMSSRGGYGIMQCNSAVHTQTGVNCQQYGASSCDHIKMMIEKQLVPDVAAVQSKHPGWTSAQALRGAVAAYDFGLNLVQTLVRLDIGSDGDDFSNDVIARAQYLIEEEGWGCTQVTTNTGGSGSTGASAGNCWELAANAKDCTFYEVCVEEALQCGAEGYPLGYGYKYCNKSIVDMVNFTTDGQAWVSNVSQCLKMELLPVYFLPGMTCQKLNEIAFNSHVKCYLQSTPNFCDIYLANKQFLWDIYDLPVSFSRDSYRQIYQILKSCSSAQTDLDAVGTHVKTLITATSDVDAAAVDQAQCEQYATAGDCRFLECFVKKFPFDSAQLENHIKAFELPLCTKLDEYVNVQQAQVGTWVTAYKKGQMQVLLTLFQASNAVNYMDIFTLFNDARVSMIYDNNAVFCSFTLGDEFYLERIINTNFPYIIPLDYASFPLSKNIFRLENYYFRMLDHMQKQVGEARKMCFDNSHVTSANFYQIIDTVSFGKLRVHL